MRDYTFHYTHRYNKGDEEIKTIFNIGLTHIAGITNGDVKTKKRYTVNSIIALENRLRKEFEAGKITNLYFGREVKVTLLDKTIKITHS